MKKFALSLAVLFAFAAGTPLFAQRAPSFERMGAIEESPDAFASLMYSETWAQLGESRVDDALQTLKHLTPKDPGPKLASTYAVALLGTDDVNIDEVARLTAIAIAKEPAEPAHRMLAILSDPSRVIFNADGSIRIRFNAVTELNELVGDDNGVGAFLSGKSLDDTGALQIGATQRDDFWRALAARAALAVDPLSRDERADLGEFIEDELARAAQEAAVLEEQERLIQLQLAIVVQTDGVSPADRKFREERQVLLTAELDETRKKRELLREKIRMLSPQGQQMVEVIDLAISIKVDERVGELQATVARQAQTIDRLRVQLAAIRQENQGLRAENASLIGRLAGLKSQIQEIAAVNLAERERIAQRLADLKTAADAAKRSNWWNKGAKSRALDAAQEEIATHEAMLAALDSSDTMLARARETMAEGAPSSFLIDDAEAILRGAPAGDAKKASVALQNAESAIQRVSARAEPTTERLAATATAVQQVLTGAGRQSDQAARAGRYHALIIANWEYESWRPLKTPPLDAERIAGILETDYGFTVDIVKNVTKADLFRYAEEYRLRKPAENLLIYYAGHGYAFPEQMRGNWIPIDARFAPGDNADEFRGDAFNWINDDDVRTWFIEQLDIRNVMIVADSCYSGRLKHQRLNADPLRTASAAGNQFALTRGGAYVSPEKIRDMSGRRARVILAAGDSDKEVADINSTGQHSLFASAFIDALEAAENDFPAMTLKGMIEQNMRAEVGRMRLKPEMQEPQYRQLTATGGHEKGADFVFVPIR
ncbi:MAG: caspase family protein [Pseudomonadota bacterium]